MASFGTTKFYACHQTLVCRVWDETTSAVVKQKRSDTFTYTIYCMVTSICASGVLIVHN